MDYYFSMINTYLGTLTDYVAMQQALANPKKSQELTEFVEGIVHTETASLMREHNEIIETQRNEITLLNSQVDRLQQERMEKINAHAMEITSLHSAHASVVQELHNEYTQKLKSARTCVTAE